MNPALLIKLRPTGPWRIGPDSGARNQVDAIYHSDTLYAAVSSAMLRLGLLQDWLDVTADGTPAVCFSSCFPFQDEIGFVVPPRTIWPPSSPALLSARVRWKSARFVPLGIVQGLLSGQPLDEEHWAVDGPSGCLVPTGRTGPFRPGLRFNAAVDRLTGAAERHSVACLEFRPGAGLWTVVRFTDQAARDRWLDPVKTAFRLLADSGFGGERSLGWGRAQMPEFTEGMLPEMILAPSAQEVEQALPSANDTRETLVPSETQPAAAADQSRDAEGAAAAPPPEPDSATPEVEPAAASEFAAPDQQSLPDESPDPAGAVTPEEAAEAPIPNPPSLTPNEAPDPQRVIPAAPAGPPQAHWLLSLFTPASTDSIDWARGNYTVVIRGGRIEAPTRSGDLKRHLQMVAEGSVLYAASAPRGAAPDVAPEGFAHPVFRAGFAVSIPLPEAAGGGQAGPGTTPPAAKVS
jgi:CRISPR type III-A-associated RAMP protein Csm4